MSQTMDPMLLSHFAFCHYNYKYDWLRPTLDEIFLKAYKKLCGKEAQLLDAEPDGRAGRGSLRAGVSGPAAAVAYGLDGVRSGQCSTVFSVFSLVRVLSAQCNCQSVHSVHSA